MVELAEINCGPRTADDPDYKMLVHSNYKYLPSACEHGQRIAKNLQATIRLCFNSIVVEIDPTMRIQTIRDIWDRSNLEYKNDRDPKHPALCPLCKHKLNR